MIYVATVTACTTGEAVELAPPDAGHTWTLVSASVASNGVTVYVTAVWSRTA
jgi:hypothetical protein